MSKRNCVTKGSLFSIFQGLHSLSGAISRILQCFPFCTIVLRFLGWEGEFSNLICGDYANFFSISPNILSISSEFHRYPRIRGINRIFLRRSQKIIENLQISAAVFRKFAKNNSSKSSSKIISLIQPINLGQSREVNANVAVNSLPHVRFQTLSRLPFQQKS